MNSNLSTGQEPNSQLDNNYVEVHGIVNTEMMNIPVGIEGFYTTQDLHRQAKASYIRFHYDVDKAKGQLMNVVSTYRNKFSEAEGKFKGIQNVYGAATNSLEGEKTKLLSDFKKDYGVDGSLLTSSGGNVDAIVSGLAKDTAGLTKALTDKAAGALDSNSTAAAAKEKFNTTKEKLLKDKEEVMKRYQKLMVLEQKAQKYYTLLEQYRTSMSLDSSLNYSKLDKLSKDPNTSYKELSKSATGLLPDGKVKRFATGLTSFDAGIINKYESDYTIAGQTIKGLSTGYDFDVVKLGVTVGKTEYISRDGSVDRYTGYLGRLDFKPIAKQKVALIYYGYTPSRQMWQDDNFTHLELAVPSFRQPVHIGSLTYEGMIGKKLLASGEAAASSKGPEQRTLSMERAAMKASLDYNLPKVATTISSQWEHLGKDFENSSLPYIKAATERYTLAAATDLFHSFLSLSVNYNYLLQQSFAAAATSTKWGFEIATHSKQYPSVAISYKPYTTFRSYSDTLAIAQRPLIGEVWIAQSTYQIKRGKTIHRFIALYNQNTSTADSINTYTSKTAQLGYIYTNPSLTYNIMAGWMALPLNTLVDTVHTVVGNNTSTFFENASINKALSKTISGTFGEDIGIAAFGLQRLSATLGMSYAMLRLPLTIRIAARYSNYRLSEQQTSRTNITAGQIGLTWRFKTSLKDKHSSSL